MNTLGVDRVFLGSIAAGIELLRAALAIAKPIDDPTELPRAYANLGSILEMGGFVEEALEVCLEGAERTLRYGSDLSFRMLPAGQCRGDADRAGAIPGGDGPAREPAAQRPARRQHDPPARSRGRTWPSGPATWPRPDGTSRSRASRRAASTTPSTSSTWHMVGTEIAMWGGDPAAAVDGRPRRVRPARRRRRRDHPRSAGDPRGSRGRRPGGPGPGGARSSRRPRTPSARRASVIDRYRAVDRAPVGTGRARHPARSAGGWRSAKPSTHARPARTIRPAGMAVRPALAARPAPFLEAYVLWRAAEAIAGPGRDGRRRRAVARGPRDRDRIGAGAARRPGSTTSRPPVARSTFAASRRRATAARRRPASRSSRPTRSG